MGEIVFFLAEFFKDSYFVFVFFVDVFLKRRPLVLWGISAADCQGG